jgi:acetyl esterase/lipase
LDGYGPGGTQRRLRPGVLAPLLREIISRLASTSEAVRARIGQPMREPYGPTAVEKLDMYLTKRPKAPIFVMIHGGGLLERQRTTPSQPK